MQHVLKVRNLKDLLVERFITIKKEINEKGKSNESRNQCIEGIDILQLQARDLKDLIVETFIVIEEKKREKIKGVKELMYQKYRYIIRIDNIKKT